MYNHAPESYKCPLCLAVQGIECEDTLVKNTDIVFRDDLATVLINSFFIKNNPGHVIVIPNKHFENLYYIPVKTLQHIVDVAQKIALVMKKSYNCEGITLLQNNEPIGDQHAFHFHLHIFPRYENDELHKNMADKKLANPKIRAEFANKIRKYL